MIPVTDNATLVQRAFWLIRLRWIAVVLVALGTFFLHDVLGIPVKATELYITVALLAAYNGILLLLLNRFADKADGTLSGIVGKVIKFQIYADLPALTVLLHYSGGIENPFVFFFIINIIVANFFLSVRESYLQATLAVLLLGFMIILEYLKVIPHYCLKGFVEHCLYRDGVYILGTFFVFATSLYLVVYMTSYITIRLRQAEQVLRASRDYLGRILNGMHDGLIVIDRDFTIKDVNGRFLEQCGVTRDEAIGSKCYEISHHADKPCSGPGHVCPVIQVFDTAETVQVEHTHFDSTSNPLFIELNAFPLFSTDGNVEAVVELSHDITERKRNEQALREANLMLQEKDRIKDEYVARLTHDIRGHLATIQSCLGLALTGTLDKQSSEFTHRAFKRTKKLTDFAKTFMTLTKIRLNGKADTSEFSLKRTLNSVVDALRSGAEEKSIKLICHIPDIVENMHGVESSIEEMLTTLLLNAIKYTPENGEITVRLTSELDSIRLQISDTGIGIPAAEQAKIFDEFYRAGKAAEVEENSPGLGLVIVKYIVEIHGGKIAVDSQEGRGTTFTIILPCVVP